MKANVEDRPNNISAPFQAIFGKEDLLARVIEYFPYPIEIYTPDGTTVMLNKAMLNEYHPVDPGMVIKKYNIFEDPYIVASGRLSELKRVLKGETIFFPDIKVPLEEIARRYNVDFPYIEAVYQDITVFPILDDEKRVVYIAVLLINRRVYRGNDDIEKAKEYIDNHWLERFDLTETAKAAHLSKAHFTKLFKKNTGLTPHQYYTNYKISKLKEKLQDTNLSVTQAFAACNMNYNGHFARVFKEKTGLSPSAYRRMAKYGARGQVSVSP